MPLKFGVLRGETVAAVGGLGKVEHVALVDLEIGHSFFGEATFPGDTGMQLQFKVKAGNLPENPSELLANGKVKDIIDYLDNIFDLVIIDTSPIVLVTDAYILSALCDATLYVIRHKYTPKILIKRIDENNRINPINNPAIIFNGVKMRGFFKNNYGYGYDYVYGNKERGKKDKKPTIKY